MQQDPHLLYPEVEYFYLFLILAPVLVGLLIFAAARMMSYLDSRAQAKQKRGQDDSAAKKG